MVGEVWKDIKGCEGKYQCSNLGRFRCLPCRGHQKTINYMNLTPNEEGYLFVMLRYNNGERKNRQAHRIIAETFIPNPENKPTVNHIDRDPSNNKVNNLEWMTQEEQNKHDFRLERVTETLQNKYGKKVECYELEEIYPSIGECAKAFNVGYKSISSCCYGRVDTIRGFHFFFVD